LNVTVRFSPPSRKAGLIDHVRDPAMSGFIPPLTAVRERIKARMLYWKLEPGMTTEQKVIAADYNFPLPLKGRL
jgi:hypothetical protein